MDAKTTEMNEETGYTTPPRNPNQVKLCPDAPKRLQRTKSKARLDNFAGKIDFGDQDTTFGNQGFGNPAFGNQDFGNPAFGNPDFGNQDFGNQDTIEQDQAGYKTPPRKASVTCPGAPQRLPMPMEWNGPAQQLDFSAAEENADMLACVAAQTK